MIRSLILVLSLFVLMMSPNSASSAKMKSHWKNPTATAASLQFSKVIVIAPIAQEMTRKVAEDKAVRIIQKGGKTVAVPSYYLLKIEELKDKEEVKKKIEAENFDGVIVFRYAGSEDAKKYEDTEDWDAYNYFWGEYYPAWGGVYNATSDISLTVFIETMFYSLKEQKLIWSGITENKDPKNPAKVVGEIAEETTKYLQKEGLLPKSK